MRWACLLFCTTFLLSACQMQPIHFQDQSIHLTVHLPETHQALEKSLLAYSSHDSKAIPLTLTIDAEKHIDSINTLTHQQNVLAYQLTYRAKVHVDHQHITDWPDQSFESTTQLLLPVNQSVNQGDEAERTWAYLSDDLANNILFTVMHRLHFTGHA
jgi:hypothetical protein